jgi:hypothetical protein
MGVFTRHRTLRRAIAAILAVLSTTACVTWRPVLGPQSYLAAQQQSHVRAGLTSGEVVDVYNPQVIGSDLVGYRKQGSYTSRVTIPASQLKYVEVPETDVGGTVLLGATIGIVLLVAVAAATFQGMRFGPTLGGF